VLVPSGLPASSVPNIKEPQKCKPVSGLTVPVENKPIPSKKGGAAPSAPGPGRPAKSPSPSPSPTPSNPVPRATPSVRGPSPAGSAPVSPGRNLPVGGPQGRTPPVGGVPKRGPPSVRGRGN